MPWPIRVQPQSLRGEPTLSPHFNALPYVLLRISVGRQTHKTLSFAHAISFSKTDWNAGCSSQLWRQLGAGRYPRVRARTVFDSIISYIVIINLIANLSFLYHKPEKHAVIRID
jgi:hypothetical protein